MAREYKEIFDKEGYRMTVFEDGELAASANILNTPSEELKSYLPKKYHDWAYFYGMQIDSRHRGRGLDLFLLRLVKRFSQAIEKPIFLLASPLEKERFSRRKLIRFYQLHGFKKLDCDFDNCMGYFPGD